jgi:high-affinity iron transporter
VGFSFLITLREGVEMALIVAILLGYLRSIGQRQLFPAIWAGVAIAGGLCLAVGLAVELLSRELDERLVEAVEGFGMLFAVAVLTVMAFWMRAQARGISASLRADVDRAMSKGSAAALVLLAATSVGREGLETVLFLFAGSGTEASGVTFVLGGLLGFAAAAAIGVAIYSGGKRFPLRRFFQVSGLALLFIAAGLLANSAVKLYEAAIISDLGSRPWDTESFIPITSTLGKFLNTLAGYDSAPSMLQIALYWSYLIAAVAAFVVIPALRREHGAPAPQAPSPTG